MSFLITMITERPLQVEENNNKQRETVPHKSIMEKNVKKFFFETHGIMKTNSGLVFKPSLSFEFLSLYTSIWDTLLPILYS